jgi:hypothetical protein
LIVTVRNAGHDFMGADIDPSRIGVDLAHTVKRTSFPLGRFAAIAFAQFAYRRLLV